MPRKSSYGTTRVASLLATAARREAEQASTQIATDLAEYDSVAEAEKYLLISQIEIEMTEAKQIKLAFPHTDARHQNAIDTIIRLGRELRELEVA